jgi:Aminoglycoside-2''-adenylyltransferase
MDQGTERQLRVIRKVIAVTQSADIPVWLFGGWGLDARIGRITREHGDVEFWVERVHAERSKAVLVEAGATALATQPPEEACEFTWGDILFSTAYFDRQPDGSSAQLLGRWSDWLFPPGSFDDEPGTLDGMPVPAMSVSGMLAMNGAVPAPAQRPAVATEGRRRYRDTPGTGRRQAGREMKAVRQPALRAWKAAISAVISSSARCRDRPSAANASVTGPSVARAPVSKCSVPM